MMKKVLLPILAVLMLMSFVGSAKAGPSIDQQYTGGTGSLAMSTGLRMAQRFMPTMTGLSKVELELTNVGSNQKISIAIRHSSGGLNWDEGSLATVSNQTVINGWNVFDFDDITVDTSPAYAIFITAADYGPQWKYSNSSGYGSGYAIFQNDPQYGWDFNFKTWGTNPVDVVDENTQPAGQAADSTLGQAPTATTSAAIKVPTGLKAVYKDKKVNLTWAKSATTEIDGYKIFRSETQTASFKEVGQTVKTVLVYTDAVGLTEGKTYYYFVRAYKDKEESASSATVKLTLVEGATAEKVRPAVSGDLEKLTSAEIRLYWFLGSLAGLLILVLIGYEIYKKRKGGVNGARTFRLFR